MRRLRRHEEHTNHERWAIPYGDLLTLLLAFFVVMYSISSVNAGKYRVLSNSLYTAFRGQPRGLAPIQISAKLAVIGAAPATGAATAKKTTALAHAAVGAPPPQGSHLSAPVHDPTLAEVADHVDRAMADLMRHHVVMVHRSPGMIEVQFSTDLLFPSGSARLSPSAVAAIQHLAAVLMHYTNPVRVEGFTDNVPIRTVQFASNWELSAARAGSVVHVLSGHGVAPSRLAVIGFGDQRPIATNATAVGRESNRRVVVVILSNKLRHHADPAWLPSSGT
ncbi:MAG: flagellar motor protein MotD [Steroidobacteraceae bacterium]